MTKNKGNIEKIKEPITGKDFKINKNKEARKYLKVKLDIDNINIIKMKIESVKSEFKIMLNTLEKSEYYNWYCSLNELSIELNKRVRELMKDLDNDK